jgi:hypothetical protein
MAGEGASTGCDAGLCQFPRVLHCAAEPKVHDVALHRVQPEFQADTGPHHTRQLAFMPSIPASICGVAVLQVLQMRGGHRVASGKRPLGTCHVTMPWPVAKIARDALAPSCQGAGTSRSKRHQGWPHCRQVGVALTPCPIAQAFFFSLHALLSTALGGGCRYLSLQSPALIPVAVQALLDRLRQRP